MQFTLSRPSVNRSLDLRDQPPQIKLTEKYRPSTLSDVVGQGAVVDQLQQFAERPYPTPMLFSGDTGLGKTTCARALANDMGVDATWDLHEIRSASCDAETLEDALKMLRFSGVNGGWKVLIIDEADTMSDKARKLLLSALEDLPARSVIVMTTNHAERFEPRFLDRCMVIPFASDCAMLYQDAQVLANRVWFGETGEPLAPPVESLPNICFAGSMSFRRVVNAVASAIQARPVLDTRDNETSIPVAETGSNPVAEPINTVETVTSDTTEDATMDEPTPVKPAKVKATRKPSVNDQADAVLLEAIESLRNGESVRKVWDLATTSQRVALTKRIKALIGPGVWSKRVEPVQRVEDFVIHCVNGSSVSFPEPAPVPSLPEATPETVPTLPEPPSEFSGNEPTDQRPGLTASIDGNDDRGNRQDGRGCQDSRESWPDRLGGVRESHSSDVAGHGQGNETDGGMVGTSVADIQEDRQLRRVDEPSQGGSGFSEPAETDPDITLIRAALAEHGRIMSNIVFDVHRTIEPGTPTSNPVGTWLIDSFSNLGDATRYAARCNQCAMVSGITYSVHCTYVESPDRLTTHRDWKASQEPSQVDSGFSGIEGPIQSCPACGGSGADETQPDRDWSDHHAESENCPRCGGFGWVLIVLDPSPDFPDTPVPTFLKGGAECNADDALNAKDKTTTGLRTPTLGTTTSTSKTKTTTSQNLPTSPMSASTAMPLAENVPTATKQGWPSSTMETTKLHQDMISSDLIASDAKAKVSSSASQTRPGETRVDPFAERIALATEMANEIRQHIADPFAAARNERDRIARNLAEFVSISVGRLDRGDSDPYWPIRCIGQASSVDIGEWLDSIGFIAEWHEEDGEWEPLGWRYRRFVELCRTGSPLRLPEDHPEPPSPDFLEESDNGSGDVDLFQLRQRNLSSLRGIGEFPERRPRESLENGRGRRMETPPNGEDRPKDGASLDGHEILVPRMPSGATQETKGETTKSQAYLESPNRPVMASSTPKTPNPTNQPRRSQGEAARAIPRDPRFAQRTHPSQAPPTFLGDVPMSELRPEPSDRDFARAVAAFGTGGEW